MATAGTRMLKAGFAFDTVIGVILVTLGAYGAKWVASPTFWQGVDPGSSGETVGNVRARKGAVRVRSPGKSVWRDVTGIEAVHQGDTVATGAGGVADLVLTRKDRLRIAPESLVVVDVAEAPATDQKPSEGFGGGWFSKVVNTIVENQKSDGVRPMAERTFIQVKKGSVAMVEPATPSAGKAKLQLEVGGKKFEAKAAQAVSVAANGQAKVASVDVAKAEQVETWAPPPAPSAPLATPKVESPVQGAVFAETSPVPFGWIPPDRAAISQIEIRQRGASRVLATRDFPGTGASLRLGRGEYEWRVRLRAQDSVEWSPWSDARTVTVVARMTKDEPVAVLQSKGGVPAQGRAALAARESWRETVAQARRLAAAPPPPKPAPVVRQGPSAEMLAAKAKAAADARQLAFAQAQARRKAQQEEAARRAAGLAQARATQAAEVQKRVAAEKKVRAALQTAVIAASLTRKVATEGKTAAFDPDKLDRIPVDIAWGTVPGAHSYRITVFQSGKQTRQEDVRMPKYGFDVKSVAETVGLEYEITALMADGSSVSGARSAIQVQLGAPTLVEPAPSTQLQAGQNSVFSWSRAALADRYELQVAQDDTFTSPLVAKNVTDNFEFITLPGAGNFFWRVRAQAGPVKSNWSKATRFQVK